MRIKFKAPDPRAGLIVEINDHLGQHFVDVASAVRLNADGTEAFAVAFRSRAMLDTVLASPMVAIPKGSFEPRDVDSALQAYRSQFGALFTEADEQSVRKNMKDSNPKASVGLTVAQIKAVLAANDIVIPPRLTSLQEFADYLDSFKVLLS